MNRHTRSLAAFLLAAGTLTALAAAQDTPNSRPSDPTPLQPAAPATPTMSVDEKIAVLTRELIDTRTTAARKKVIEADIDALRKSKITGMPPIRAQSEALAKPPAVSADEAALRAAQDKAEASAKESAAKMSPPAAAPLRDAGAPTTSASGQTLSANGTLAPVHPADAPLKFETTLHDWGRISDAEPVTYSYKVKNGSEKAVNIVGVHASCGCTGSAASKLHLEPGEETTIDVRFDPTNRSGPETKTITVTTDGDGVKEYQLIAASQVVKTIAVEPPALYFAALPPGKGGAQEITVTSRTPDFEVKGSAITGLQAEHLKVEQVSKDTVDLDGSPATRYRYRVTSDAAMPIGAFSAILNLETNLATPKFQRAVVSVNGEVAGGLMFGNGIPLIYVRMAVPGESIVGETQLVSRSNQPFKIVSARFEGVPASMHPIVDIKPRERGDRAAQRIIMSALAPNLATDIKGELVLTTDVADMREVRLKLQGVQVPLAQPMPMPQNPAVPATTAAQPVAHNDPAK